MTKWKTSSEIYLDAKDLYKIIGTTEILHGLVEDGHYTEIVSKQTGELFTYSDIQKTIYLLESMVDGITFNLSK